MSDPISGEPAPFTVVVSASTVPAHAGDPAPRFVLDQAVAFAELGVTVHVLAPCTPSSRGHTWPKQEARGLTQWRFRYAPRRWELLTDHGIMPILQERPWLLFIVPALAIAQFFALWRLVLRVRPDIIHAHWFTPQALTAFAVARLTNTPFGYTTHASDVDVWRRFGVLGRTIVRKVTSRTAFTSAVSTQTAAKLRAFFDKEELQWLDSRLKIIPMGIHLPAMPPEHGNSHHVVIMARLVEKKGIEILLKAWPCVIEALPDARLTIAGTGPLEGRLRGIIEQLGMEIDMPGHVTGPDKVKLYASSGVVVQPSVVASDVDTDGLPVALMEGIAAGCIPVASDASGGQDIIENGKHGYLVSSGDTTALAHALIAAMTLSDGERKAMLAYGRKLSLKLSWPQVAQAHLSLLREAAAPPGTNG